MEQRYWRGDLDETKTVDSEGSVNMGFRPLRVVAMLRNGPQDTFDSFRCLRSRAAPSLKHKHTWHDMFGLAAKPSITVL